MARAETTTKYPSFVAADGSGALAICPSGEELRPGSRCTHDAYVGSVDGLWRSSDGEILLSA